MARIYTDRARGRQGSGGREYESSATALKRMTNGRTLYAEVMALAARINYIHHNVWEACMNLWEAVDLDPHNLENRRLLAEFEERHNILSQRQDVKREAWKRETLRQGERVEGE